MCVRNGECGVARIRSIKPQFFQNEEVAALPFQWRLLFIGLWTQADRDGRLEDRPARLKAMLFPYDDLQIDEGLGCLVNAGLLTRYDGNGLRLIAIPTWAKHQQPHVKEAQSEYPPPVTEKPGASPVRAPLIRSRSRSGADPDPDQGRSTSALRALFERFWAEYPRKVGKDAALKEWLRRSPDDALTERMIVAVRAQRASAQWRKDDGEFIPHPRTWLHQGRWQDEQRPTPARRGERQETTEEYVERIGYCQHKPTCEKPGAAACRARQKAVAS